MDKEKNKETKKNTGGKFQKGHKKVGGRKAGSKNKVTKDLRRIIEEQLTDHLQNLNKIIASIKEPDKKAVALAHWANYILPKYSNTTINSDSKRDLTTEEYLLELERKYNKKDISIDISEIKIINNH